MDIVEQLLAIEEIKRLFAGRLRCMDGKDWEHYGDFHTLDVVSRAWSDIPNSRQPTGTGEREVVGREPLTAAVRAALDGTVLMETVHHGHSPEIEILTDTTAIGLWAMEDRLWWRNGDHEEHLYGYGYYDEQYRKVAGWWLISARTLRRLRVETTAGFFSRARQRS